LPDVFNTIEFINADEIARGLSPLNPSGTSIKGLANFTRYAAEADDWYIYDNSGPAYELVAYNANGEQKIINFELFKIVSGNE